MKRKIWHFGMVAALFLLSLIPRVKNIQTGNYPAVIPHLQVLQVIRVWDETSPAHYGFMPIQTWSKPSDKFITYFPRLVNDKGDNYYVSYPPFAFVLAWAFCKLLGLPFSVLSITILNLLLQWIAAWCVFSLVRRLLPPLTAQKIYWPGLAAAAVFICNPASMRIFSQVYFSESVGTALLCIFAYFVVWVTQEPKSYRAIIGTGVFLFLLVHTEWIGLFAVLCFGLFWFIKGIRDKAYRKLFLLAALSGVTALLLFIYQLDFVSGNTSFIANLKERYLARSGVREQEKAIGDTVFKDGFVDWVISAFRVTLFAARWFFPVLFVGGLYVYFKKGKQRLESIPALSKWLMFVLFVVVLANFLALLNFSLIHSYTWAKWGLVLALATAYCVHVLVQHTILKWVTPLILIAFFVSDLIFYQGFSSKDAAPDYWIELTEYIKKEAKPDETIFITTVSEEIDPTFHLTYYTGRNMMNVNSKEQAQIHAENLGREKWVWFNFNQYDGLKEAHHEQH